MSDRIEAEILDVFGEEVAASVDTPLVVIEGTKGDPGAPGKDGVSPTVSTAATTGGTKVTITDAKGSHEFVVKDGAKGADGSNGKDGTNGKDGADGKPGAAGADGVTPHIGDNGNWYLGATDTGKPSRGATGAKGDTGAPGKDGTKGDKGETGPQGPAGAPGKDGAGMDITGAKTGQIAKITAVDASGVPIAWGPADMPSGGSSFTDDGAGNISVDGAAAQSVDRFLQSLTFPGLNFKYINPLNSGTYSNPYGVYVGSGASLVDTILTKTVPGVYTVYMNRNATDVPEAAAAASSSLRGLVILSQIKKHYAIILLVDQSSNFYVQYIQNDVGGGWKQMPDSSAAAEAVLYTAQTLTEAQQFQARKNIGAVGHDSPQFQGYVALAPANETLGSGVGLSPTGSGHNYTLDISDVDESNPTLLTGVKTPTDADNSAAANVEYVKAKVAGASGGTANAVLYTEQTLTDAQKKQARENVDAASDFVVTATPSADRSVTIDKTFAQIQAAISAGKTPIVVFGDFYLQLAESTEEYIAFITGGGDRSAAFLGTLYVYPGQSPQFERITVQGLNSDGTMPQINMEAAPTSDMEIANKKYVDDSANKKLNQTEPVIKDGLTIENGSFAIRTQPNSLTSATGEDFASLDFSDSSPQAAGNGIVIDGLANFGDAEAVGLENTAVSYAQLVGYTKPLTLTYANSQVTGASYTDIRKAIERGRQIKLAVANTVDIIATNAKNETDKSVLKFIETDVGGDTVFFKQYYVTAQTSGITVNTKSMELP